MERHAHCRLRVITRCGCSFHACTDDPETARRVDPHKRSEVWACPRDNCTRGGDWNGVWPAFAANQEVVVVWVGLNGGHSLGEFNPSEPAFLANAREAMSQREVSLSTQCPAVLGPPSARSKQHALA
jgi:hypothetical protein